MPELKPSVNGSFELAVQSPRIRFLSDLEPLKQALRYSMLLVGLRANNLPNEHEKAILIGYILKNYGGHTADEIKLAFEMAVTGDLGLSTDEVKCYENFSCLYFSTIMNAYRKWAVTQDYSPPAKPLPPVDKVTIDLEYCYCKQKEINKLPFRLKCK